MTLYVKSDLWRQVRYLVRAALPDEIIILAATREFRKGRFLIEKIYVPSQIVNEVHSRTIDQALNKIIVQAMKDGYSPANLNCRIHSHGLGPVFWSKEDEADILKVLKMADFTFNIVVNGKGKRLVRYDSARREIFKWPLTLKVLGNWRLLMQCFLEVERKLRHEPIKEDVLGMMWRVDARCFKDE